MGAAPPSPETSDGGVSAADRDWVADAVRLIEADFNRSADTHLIRVDLPRLTAAGVDLYLKDESTHPSGSLKHRLARSLFLYGLCNGWIRRGKPVIEASSGSTAISEAYFARLLGLPFVAVAPRATAKPKIEAIEFLGGEVRLAEPAQIYDEARRVAEASGGHYMDQFTYAERATDWRGNNNIAESLLARALPRPCLGRRQRRHRRHVVDHRPIHALQPAGARRDAALRGRSGEFSVLRFVSHRRQGACVSKRARGSRVSAVRGSKRPSSRASSTA